MAKINPVQFLKEVRTELKKVIWPTRKEAVKLTLIVVLISSAVGVFIASMDYALTRVMALIIK